uniref:Uncharacterized protein n=1 Tax=Aegilops tauschii subsp. strangulata TaxID=200361 RepID=A0A452YM57_AEGTS
LYILASEPVKIPWFDAVYADIGDEQSLTQSLSTFSGHLKQIGHLNLRFIRLFALSQLHNPWSFWMKLVLGQIHSKELLWGCLSWGLLLKLVPF